MIEETLCAVLLNDSAVSALVGDRVYPLALPDKLDKPAIVYQRVSTAPTTSLEGDSGLDAVRIQVTAWGKTYQQAKEVAAASRAAITMAMTAVTEMILDAREIETRLFAVITDYRIWEK